MFQNGVRAVLLVLLHEGGPIAGVPPGIRYIEVRGNRDQSIGSRTVAAAVLRLDASRVHALDRQLEELELVIVTLAGDADYRVQRHFHVGQLLGLLIEEESDDAAQYSLMRHHENVVGTLQLGDHRVDALHRVDVTLAPRITITQLVLIAPSELLLENQTNIIDSIVANYFSRSTAVIKTDCSYLVPNLIYDSRLEYFHLAINILPR